MANTRSVTSEDVAKQAGVSRAVVSVVLSGKQGSIRVSDETRERVLAVAKELSYVPHRFAQALRQQRSGIIGFIPNPVRESPFEHPISAVLRLHLARAAAQEGHHIIEASSGVPASQVGSEFVELLHGYRVDGVIFERPVTAEEVQQTVSFGFPIVQLVRPQPVGGTSTVTVDGTKGINEAVDHLVELGHTRISFIGHRGTHPIDRARLDVFLSALSRHGISLPDGYVQLRNEYSIDEGYSATKRLLELTEQPTALFAAGDNLASGALRALYEVRRHVPESMSVISYDDAFAAYLHPPMTSVAQPFEQIAKLAVSLVMEQIDDRADQPKEPSHMVLPTHLVIRNSTQPPPREIGGCIK